jgi:hypothetical protein
VDRYCDCDTNTRGARWVCAVYMYREEQISSCSLRPCATRQPLTLSIPIPRKQDADTDTDTYTDTRQSDVEIIETEVEVVSLCFQKQKDLACTCTLVLVPVCASVSFEKRRLWGLSASSTTYYGDGIELLFSMLFHMHKAQTQPPPPLLSMMIHIMQNKLNLCCVLYSAGCFS